MNKNISILIGLILLPLMGLAQKQDHIWLMGFSITINDPLDTIWGNTTFDFNGMEPRIYYDPFNNVDFGATNVSISDRLGRLQIYSQGMEVFDTTHQPIINGDTIGYGQYWESQRIWWDGVKLSAGLNFRQGALLLDHPRVEDQYFLFHPFYNFDIASSENVLLSIISKTVNGEWIVSEKDHALFDDGNYESSCFTACRHANGEDWWIININEGLGGIQVSLFDGFTFTTKYKAHEGNFSGDGSYIGTATFSPDGQKLGITFSDLVDHPQGLKTFLYDFDRCSGELSLIDNDAIYNPSICGSGTFSPNNKYYYSTEKWKIYQYDMEAADIIGSRLLVAEYDGFEEDITGIPQTFGPMINGPDGRIYIVACSGSSTYMGVIEYPNRRDTLCEIRQHSIHLPTSIGRTLPNFPNYRLGPLDGSDCDTLGVDNHPIAKFRYVQDTTDHFQIDFVDLSYYRPEDYSWDFGDGETSTDENPTHTFDGNGVYEVCLTVSNENSSNTSCRTIMLGTTAVGDELLQADISLFPNPVKDDMILSFHDYIPLEGVLVLYDTQGRKIAKYDIQSGMNMVDLSDLHTGVYLYQVLDGTQVLKSGKLSKM